MDPSDASLRAILEVCHDVGLQQLSALERDPPPYVFGVLSPLTRGYMRQIPAHAYGVAITPVHDAMNRLKAKNISGGLALLLEGHRCFHASLRTHQDLEDEWEIYFNVGDPCRFCDRC